MMRATLLLISVLFCEPAFAQTARHDVLLYRDSMIVRGIIREVMQDGNTYINTFDGRHRVCFWYEISKRLQVPADIPDSLLTIEHILFLRPLGKEEEKEDILIRTDGTILRGLLLHPPDPLPARLWTTDGAYYLVPPDDVADVLRLPKGTPDSTIDVYYIHPTPELLADNFRILIIEGGANIAMGGFAKPDNHLLMGADAGVAFGLHAGIRVFPGWRWATSVIYARQGLELQEELWDFWGEATLPPAQCIWALSGVEYRLEGTSPWKPFGFVQAGFVRARLPSFNFTTQDTRVRPGGNGTQTESSGSGFAYSFGFGVAGGPFSVIARYLSGSVPQEYVTTLDIGIPQQFIWTFSGDQSVSVLQLTLGFSPF